MHPIGYSPCHACFHVFNNKLSPFFFPTELTTIKLLYVCSKSPQGYFMATDVIVFCSGFCNPPKLFHSFPAISGLESALLTTWQWGLLITHIIFNHHQRLDYGNFFVFTLRFIDVPRTCRFLKMTFLINSMTLWLSCDNLVIFTSNNFKMILLWVIL